jgi:glucan 1,3-beta-glucosidase
MVKVGNAGDVGVAQFTDMLFTVADVLQGVYSLSSLMVPKLTILGATLVEVNIAGSSPGAVGFWNSHFRVGGAAGSKVETNCGGSGGGGTPAQCKAAYLLIHLTSTSSAYIEDMWGM